MIFYREMIDMQPKCATNIIENTIADIIKFAYGVLLIVNGVRWCFLLAEKLACKVFKTRQIDLKQSVLIVCNKIGDSFVLY